MTDSRRSNRSRKAVNYSNFCVDGGEEDDDFADPTPPSKKSKSSNKENASKKKRENPAVKKSSEEKGPSSRPSLENKLYDRDLEAALKLSLESSQAAVAEITVETHTDRPFAEQDKDSKLCQAKNSNSLLPELKSDGKEEEEIVLLSSEIEEISSENVRKRRLVASKRIEEDTKKTAIVSKTEKEVESDFDGNDDDDDEFNPSDSDSDYGSTKKKKQKTVEKLKSKQAANKTPKAKPNAVSKRIPAQPIKSSKSPITPLRSTGASALKRSWQSPSPAGSQSSPMSSLSIKSPSSGLRLGLSRNQRVKSLHPTVAS